MDFMPSITQNIVYFLVILFLSDCAQPQESEVNTKARHVPDIEILNKQLDDIESLCPDLDIEDYLSYFHKDAILLPPEQGPIEGIEAIREFYGMFDQSLTLFHCVYSERKFEIQDSMAVRRYHGLAKNDLPGKQ